MFLQLRDLKCETNVPLKKKLKSFYILITILTTMCNL